MALSNADNPLADPPKSAPSTPKSTATGAALARASESGDPAVHKLLAERQNALIVKRDLELRKDDTIGEYQAIVERVDADLAALGFTV
jgi:hypothetical protein